MNSFEKNKTLSSPKSLGLIIVSGLLTLASLYALSLPFQVNQGIYYWLGVMTLLVITLVILSFSVVFNYSRDVYAGFAWLASVTVLMFFPWHFLQVLAALGILVGLLQMNKSIATAYHERLHFSYYQTVKKGMSAFLISLIFLVSVNIFLRTYEDMRQDPQRFYDNTAVAIVKGAQPILRTKIPGFSTDMTLDQFLLRGEVFDVDFAQIDGRPVDQAGFAEFRENLLEAFGVGASGDEQVLVVLQRVVSSRVAELFGPVSRLIPLLYALLLFLSLRFVMPVLIWVSGGLGVLLFKVARKIGIVQMKTETAQVETPVLI